MKKRKPDILYDGFRTKFFEHELEPHPDLKEKIFSDLYSKKFKNQGTQSIFTNRPEQKSSVYKYAIAASIIGILLTAGIFYLSGRSQEENTHVAINAHKPIINPENKISNGTAKKENSRLDLSFRSSQEKNKKSEIKIYKSEKEKLVLFLPDSSKVYLNKYSELSYNDNFVKGERIIYMNGEVYFDVKKINKRPFIVYTKISRVEVLGTSFSIKSLPEGKEEVIVESGQVLFSEKENKEKNKIVLTPGMKAYLEAGRPIVNIMTDHSNDLSWKTNKLIFNKAPIKEVIEKMESYFEVKIKLIDPKVLNCHFTGNFEKPQSLEEVLEIISLSINGSYEIKNKEYILRSEGCN
jgi:hypothetical protein